MRKPKTIKELLESGGPRLTALNTQAAARGQALEHVRTALPAPLSDAVVSAGVVDGQLTVGVASAAWAARLRYATETLSLRVGTSLGIKITRVKIKVVPPQA